MLVCGNSGISVEDLKSLKRNLKAQGFKCQLGAGGWLYFYCNSEKEGMESWEVLLQVLLPIKQITPLYFKVGDRLIGLNYGKACIGFSRYQVVNLVLLRGLRNLIQFSLKQRVGFVKGLEDIKKKEVQEDGAN